MLVPVTASFLVIFFLECALWCCPLSTSSELSFHPSLVRVSVTISASLVKLRLRMMFKNKTLPRKTPKPNYTVTGKSCFCILCSCEQIPFHWLLKFACFQVTPHVYLSSLLHLLRFVQQKVRTVRKASARDLCSKRFDLTLATETEARNSLQTL